MNPHNLKQLNIYLSGNLNVLDKHYNIGFNHDFKTDKNTLTHLGGTFEEVKELESILSLMVKHDFRILIINHSKVNGIVEKSWPLEKVSVIELPDHDKWKAKDHHRKTILRGVHINV